MKKIAILLATSAVVLLAAGCATTTIPTFGAEIGMISNPIPFMSPIRVP